MGLFDRLESKLEQGVNGAFARAFKSEVQPVEIASGIRRAMDDRAASVGKGKRPIVPNLFTIELSPTDYDRLAAWGDDLDDELIASAQEHADEQRYMPGGPLTIVLAESDTLETGVFRLRPATAKAADALAHQRSHPRPQPGTSHDAGRSHHHDTNDDAAERWSAQPANRAGEPRDAHSDDRFADDRQASGAAAGTAGGAKFALPGAGTQRPFGARVKDYLLGGYADDAASPARAADARGHENPADDGARDSFYDDDRHDGAYAENHSTADHDAAYEYSDDVHSAAGYDDAHADGRSMHSDPYAASPYAADSSSVDDYDAHDYDDDEYESSPTNTSGLGSQAWDDDSDYGDPTGYEPAPAPREAPVRRAPSPRERPWLKIDGQRYPLLGAITVLGRDDDADIVIDDPGVSRRHSEVRITHDGPHLVMSVRDLGSTNGTYVNGDPIDSAHVHDGDRLTLGRTPMTIHLGDRQ